MTQQPNRVLRAAHLATHLAAAALALFAAAGAASAATIVYQNNFNAPVGWTDQSGNGTGISFQQVNTLYGAAFQQTFTVETVKIAGNAFYSDPSGTGGAYSLGMLSSVQNDLLSLTFNVAGLSFVNINLDLAGIGPVACPACGGPFAVVGQTPVMDLMLYDTPSGSFNISSPGSSTLLSSGSITGNLIASTTTLTWKNGTASLSTAGRTNGIVTLLLDLRAGAGLAGYSAFDNIVIASSDTPGDVGTPPTPTTPGVPEPASLALAALGLLATTLASRRGRRGDRSTA